MPKESLKDKLEGNELDLSLSDIAGVPVKELAALPKATRIDLSCNLITSIPPEFCNLNHIVKLDLSKNKLTELPANFGNLSRMQHLDLLGNNLTTLPVSMWKLTNLRWLDVKDNPLDEKLKKVVGDCLDESQCRKAAKNLIAYMKTVQSDQEREKQRVLKIQRAEEAAKKEEEEREKQRQKAHKKAEREKRKREFQAAKAEKDRQNTVRKEKEVVKSSSSNGTKSAPKKPVKSGGSRCWGIFLTFILSVVAGVVGFYLYCEHVEPSLPLCRQTKNDVLQYYRLAEKTLHHYRQQWQV